MTIGPPPLRGPQEIAKLVMERCDILARYSEEPDRITRRFATPPMHQVNEKVAAWMKNAGMKVWRDKIGNLIGRYEADQPETRTLLLGSHLDTVRDAGRYDGPLGVMIALACVERLHQQRQHLPFAIEVLAFADEEGLRYHTAYLGSKVVAGTLDLNVLQWLDSDAIPLEEAIRAFGGDPNNLWASKRRPDDLLGYCEVHIEQGPVLEALDLPVGVVTAISGQNRVALSFTGQAGHAGTVPMSMRQDALCAAAEFVLAAETIGRSQPDLVTTIGQLTVQPGASNVIPGLVFLSLDVRHQDNAIRARALHQLRERAHSIATSRQLSVVWDAIQEHPTVSCSPNLTQRLAQAVEAAGYPVHELPSGAGHDGVSISELTKIAMLFVRCKGGISHNPAESVTAADVTAAIQIMEHFLRQLAQEQGQL
jgi:allantoate deiminase